MWLSAEEKKGSSGETGGEEGILLWDVWHVTSVTS